jgi:metal-responsive CopG/Arc/MetJ family transcriptional regulator
MLRGHTLGMKVAVSIPDTVFAETELLAKQLKTTRSQVYSRALHEFLGRHAPERVTERMNQVIEQVGAATDAFSKKAARQALARAEW